MASRLSLAVGPIQADTGCLMRAMKSLKEVWASSQLNPQGSLLEPVRFLREIAGNIETTEGQTDLHIGTLITAVRYATSKTSPAAASAKIRKIVEKGTVIVSNLRPSLEKSSIGSGVGVLVGEDERDWFFLTSRHVVSPSRFSSVLIPGVEKGISATRVDSNYDGDDNDLALLQVRKSSIPPGTSLGKVPLAAHKYATWLEHRQNVYAASFDYRRNLLPADEDRTWMLVKRGVMFGKSFQIDKPLWEGASGSPVVDEQGYLIGIVRSINNVASEAVSLSALHDFLKKYNVPGLRIATAVPVKDAGQEQNGGNIVGSEVTPNEEFTWRVQIEKESDDIKRANPEIVKLVEERSARLLQREGDIRAMLERNGVKSDQITNVINALRNPAAAFQWFDAIIERPKKYLLGTESALAANLVRYLRDQELNQGIGDLIDEYLLHEAMERTNLDHSKIIALTRDHFIRDEGNPLGKALSSFIKFDARSYAPKLSDRDIQGIHDHVEEFERSRKAAKTATQRAQLYLKVFERIEIPKSEMTAERMMELLLGSLKREFAEIAEAAIENIAVLEVVEAMIELDTQKSVAFFTDLLVHEDAGIRLTAASVLKRRLHWKPQDSGSKAILMMALQEWDRLKKFGRKHLTETLKANRIALLGTGLVRAGDDKPFAHEAAIGNLVELGQPAETVILQGLRRSDAEIEHLSYDEWDYRIAVLKALEQMPLISREALAAAEQVVTNALHKGDDYLAQEAGMVLQKLRMAA